MMKNRILACAAVLGLLLTGASCDSHSWEITRKLHGHGHGDHSDEHGKTEGHGSDTPPTEVEHAKKDDAKKDH